MQKQSLHTEKKKKKRACTAVRCSASSLAAVEKSWKYDANICKHLKNPPQSHSAVLAFVLSFFLYYYLIVFLALWLLLVSWENL